MASSYYGFPRSTTHSVSGPILGAGVGKRLADVHWGMAARTVAAWLLTLPAAIGLFIVAQRRPVSSADV